MKTNNKEKLFLVNEGPNLLKLDRDWWKIYNSSFPQRERENHSLIVKRIKTKHGKVFAAKSENKTIGIGNVHFLRKVPVAFLTFLAVSKKQRGKHIGTSLFNFAWKNAIKNYGTDFWGMIWEVDNPKFSRSKKEQENDIKR